MDRLENGNGEQVRGWADRYVREGVGYRVALACIMRRGVPVNNAEEQAQEVVHETVMYVRDTVTEGGHKIESYEHFEHTVHALVAMRSVGPYRREKRHHRNRVQFSGVDADGTGAVAVAAVGPSPSDRMESAELRSAVREAVAELGSRDRALFRLRFEQGLTFKEIGEVLGTKLARTYNDYRRLLNRLRGALGAKMQLD